MLGHSLQISNKVVMIGIKVLMACHQIMIARFLNCRISSQIRSAKTQKSLDSLGSREIPLIQKNGFQLKMVGSLLREMNSSN